MANNLLIYTENTSYIENFLYYMSNIKNKRPETIIRYRACLDAFEKYFRAIDDSLTWETVSSFIIKEYMIGLSEKMKKSSVRIHISAIKSLYNYYKRINIILNNPAETIIPPKQETLLPKFIHEKDMNRLLDTKEFWKDDYNSVLEKTIILLFYHTGIRLAELVSLNENSIDYNLRTIRVIGKGDKMRIIPFGDELYNALIKYLNFKRETFGDIDIKAFFIKKYYNTKAPKRISRSLVSIIVKNKLSLVTSEENASPHKLRHTFATAMLNNGAKITSIQLLMGHDRLATTLIYTHIALSKMMNDYNRALQRT